MFNVSVGTRDEYMFDDTLSSHFNNKIISFSIIASSTEENRFRIFTNSRFTSDEKPTPFERYSVVLRILGACAWIVHRRTRTITYNDEWNGYFFCSKGCRQVYLVVGRRHDQLRRAGKGGVRGIGRENGIEHKIQALLEDRERRVRSYTNGIHVWK